MTRRSGRAFVDERVETFVCETRPVSVGDPMGIYDREYYREDSRGMSWFSGPGAVCKLLIAVNIAVYFLQLALPRHFTESLRLSSDLLFQGAQPWRLVTAAFAHDRDMLQHIIMNMLLLWFVGRELESLYSPRDFLFIYLSSAIVSNLGWATVDHFFHGGGGEVLGASGAVMSLAVIYALFYPHQEVLFMFVVRMEVWMLVAIGIAFDLLFLITQTESKTAYAAHLAGAAYGFMVKTMDLRPSSLMKRWRRPRLRVVRPPEPQERERPRDVPTVRGTATWSSEPANPGRATVSVVASEEQLDAKLDEVLAKIAREGRGNLNEEDNRILQEASRRAKNRRSERL